MRATLAALLLTLLPASIAAQPASAQSARGTAYLSPMGEPFVAPTGASALALWLAAADRDKNGAVSLAELTLDADRFFKRLDADADGRIGGYEMTRYEEQIAPASLRAAAGIRPVGSDRSLRPEGREPGDFSGRSADPGRGRAGLPGGMTGPQLSLDGAWSSSDSDGGLASIPQPVAMTDTDMSGSVTPEEFARAASRRFALLDASKNGQLESGELARSRR
jgi:hypothetical protein